MGASLAKVRDWPSLQGWSFFDEDLSQEPQSKEIQFGQALSSTSQMTMTSQMSLSTRQARYLKRLANEGYAKRVGATADRVSPENYAERDMQKWKALSANEL